MNETLLYRIAKGINKAAALITRSGETQHPLPKSAKRQGKRTLTSAINTGRLMGHWKQFDTIEQFLKSNWIVRERARDLERTDDFAQRFLAEFEANVSGPNGFTFQSNVTELLKDANGVWNKTQDELANTKIEEAFAEFTLSQHCTINGQHSLSELEILAERMWARDGEAFIRIIPYAEAKFGIQLQLLEAESVDEMLNTVLENGNIIKMGVEIDAWRKPVAYYIRKRNPGMELWGSIQRGVGEYDRIPAEQILHLFSQQHPNQTRGISLMVQSMVRLKRLSDYEEAVLLNAQTAASKMGFLSDKNPLMPEQNVLGQTVDDTGEDPAGDSPDEGDQQIEVAAGTVEDIGAREFTAWSPEFPTAQHEMLVKTTTHATTAGLLIDYASGTNDLGDTSYSSARVGLMDVRELWKMRQKKVIDRVLLRLYPNWVKFAILSGALNLPMAKLDKWMKPVFIGRRWSWVDPLKDIMASALEIEYGLGTRTQKLAELGYDINEVDNELAAEAAASQKKGVVLKYHDKATFSGATALNDAAAIDPNAPPAMMNEQSPNQKKTAAARQDAPHNRVGAQHVVPDEESILVQAAAILLKRKSNGHNTVGAHHEVPLKTEN